MTQEPKLYVLAEFDRLTDRRLSDYRDRMVFAGFIGEQTAGPRHHITLGSYPLDCAEKLLARLERERNGRPIPVRFPQIGTFGDRVLFVAAEEDAPLRALHAKFDDGDEWVPHATMYLTEEGGVEEARAYLEMFFEPFEGEITRLALYEFFPSKLIAAVELVNG
ncbi:MAG: 2'-5' RNA ligase family protein [Christensenellales bacterium]|jgi:2'-5' RNA ligase